MIKTVVTFVSGVYAGLWLASLLVEKSEKLASENSGPPQYFVHQHIQVPTNTQGE